MAMMTTSDYSPSQLKFIKSLTIQLKSLNQNSNLFIQSKFDSNYLISLIEFILTSNITTTNSTSAITSEEEEEVPTIQDLLNKFVTINLNEVNSTKTLFDQILNHFSNWSSSNHASTSNNQGGIHWNIIDGKVENWDRKREGLRVVKRGRVVDLKGKKRAREEDEEDEEDDELVIEGYTNRKGKGKQRQEEEEEEEEDPREWRLEWNTNEIISPPREEVPFIKDSLDHFHDGLKSIYSLGKEEQSSEAVPTRTLDPKSRRWIILDHGEKLHDLASAGNAGGAPKETGLGMTFAASMHRLGELTALPISTITISKVEWSKAREGLVGLKDPTVLIFPALEVVDIVRILSSRFQPVLPHSDKMTPLEVLNLFKSLVKQICVSFASLVAHDLEELSYLTVKFWPQWLMYVERGNPPILPTDEGRLMSNIKSSFSAELAKLTTPRLLLSKSIPTTSLISTSSSTMNQNVIASSSSSSSSSSNFLQGFAGSMPSLPTPSPIFNPSTIPDSPLRPRYTEERPITPIHRQVLSHSSLPTTSQPNSPQTLQIINSTSTSLSKSLPILSKYLLLASFYAGFNPPSSDVRHFVKIDEGIAKRGRKVRKMKMKPGRGPLTAKVRTELGGGKTFPIERMLAIFEAILDSDEVGKGGINGIGQSVDVLMQVTTLINLRLLQRVSGQDKVMDGIKLKCKLTKDMIDLLAKSIGKSDWTELLWDADR